MRRVSGAGMIAPRKRTGCFRPFPVRDTGKAGFMLAAFAHSCGLA